MKIDKITINNKDYVLIPVAQFEGLRGVREDILKDMEYASENYKKFTSEDVSNVLEYDNNPEYEGGYYYGLKFALDLIEKHIDLGEKPKKEGLKE